MFIYELNIAFEKKKPKQWKQKLHCLSKGCLVFLVKYILFWNSGLKFFSTILFCQNLSMLYIKIQKHLILYFWVLNWMEFWKQHYLIKSLLILEKIWFNFEFCIANFIGDDKFICLNLTIFVSTILIMSLNEGSE